MQKGELLAKLLKSVAMLLICGTPASETHAVEPSKEIPAAFIGFWAPDLNGCRDRDYFMDYILDINDRSIVDGEDGASIEAVKVESASVIYVTANFGGGSADSVMKFTLQPDKNHLVFHWMDHYREDKRLMRCPKDTG